MASNSHTYLILKFHRIMEGWNSFKKCVFHALHSAIFFPFVLLVKLSITNDYRQFNELRMVEWAFTSLRKTWENFSNYRKQVIVIAIT